MGAHRRVLPPRSRRDLNQELCAQSLRIATTFLDNAVGDGEDGIGSISQRAPPRFGRTPGPGLMEARALPYICAPRLPPSSPATPVPRSEGRVRLGLMTPDGQSSRPCSRGSVGVVSRRAPRISAASGTPLHLAQSIGSSQNKRFVMAALYRHSYQGIVQVERVVRFGEGNPGS